MWSFSWLRIGKKHSSGKHNGANRSPRRRAGFRPRLEGLEDRCLPSFTTPTYYPTGPSPQAVVTADLNGDGKLDLVTANLGTFDSTGKYVGGGGVSVLLGTTTTTTGKKGNSSINTFAPAQNYAVGATGAIVVGDINGDGKPDIVCDNGSVLLNNGDGTFRSGPSIAGGVGAFPNLIDLNGEGKLDLVAENSVNNVNPSSTIRVLLGNGDGTFRVVSTYTIPLYLQSLVVGNFNADSHPDIIAANDVSLSLLPGNGDGTFGAAQTVASFSNSNSQIVSVVAARFNADANLDLAVAYVGTNSTGGVDLQFLMGHGDGTFTYASSSFFSFTFGAMAAADINHDGKMDLVGVGYDGVGAIISVLPGNGDGTFGARQDFRTGGIVHTPTALAIGDFNGDGYLDVALAGPDGVDVLWWVPPGVPVGKHGH
jgi:hypothetical protein